MNVPQFFPFSNDDLVAVVRVGNERLIHSEAFLVRGEQPAPILNRRLKRLLLLDTDEEPSLMIEEAIQIHKNVMNHVSRENATLYDVVLELLQDVQMPDIVPFSRHQLFNYILLVVTLLRPDLINTGEMILRAQKQTILRENIKNAVYDLENLDKTIGVLAQP